MSSWPPHLPIAMTDSRPARGLLPHPGPGHRQPGLEGAGGEVGQLGGDVVDADVVGEVAGGQAEQHAAVLHPQRVDRLRVGQGRHRVDVERVGTDRGQQAARTAYAAGRVEPSVGSVSSRQCSGWRTRWSASA